MKKLAETMKNKSVKGKNVFFQDSLMEDKYQREQDSSKYSYQQNAHVNLRQLQHLPLDYEENIFVKHSNKNITVILLYKVFRDF